MNVNGDYSFKRLYTLKEAAVELRISNWLLSKLIRTNQIVTVKIAGRRFITNDDIDVFINKQKVDRYET